ncbi:DUF2846 domain-containing protein [Pseudomonas sp. CrR25]|nr:DUF2846 domain-containing protein [Pseudomonas sp. CrR25]
MRRLQLFVLLLSVALAGCSTPGAFFGATEGPAFREQRQPDDHHARVYLYRPQSAWADQELEAPGLFLDNRWIGSLPSNGHLALEFEIDSYRLEMRRPLFGSYWTLLADGPLDFARIASFALEAEAGGIYYLRYDERDPPALGGDVPSEGDGPLHVVPARLALTEISATRAVQPPARIAARAEAQRLQHGFWRGLERALEKIGI